MMSLEMLGKKVKGLNNNSEKLKKILVDVR